MSEAAGARSDLGASGLGPPDPVATAPLGASVTSLLGRLPGGVVVDQVHTDDAAPFAVWSRRYLTFLILADVALGATSAWFVLVVLRGAIDLAGTGLLVAAVMVCWPLAIASAHGYRRRDVGAGTAGGPEVRALPRAAVRLICLTAVGVVLLGSLPALTFGVGATLLAASSGILLRIVGRAVVRRAQRQGRGLRRVAVVGSARSAARLATLLDEDASAGVEVVGAYVPADQFAAASALDLDVLGEPREVGSDAVGEGGFDAVAVTGGEAADPRFVRRLAWALEGEDVELMVDPGLSEVSSNRVQVESSDSLPLLHVDQPHFSGPQQLVKRAMDLVLATVGLLLAWPVLVIIAVAIKLDDRGPVFFTQTRVGRRGRTFTMWKFRSMRTDAEHRRLELLASNEASGPLFKMVDDPRITTVGRLLRRHSLDELPQLLNVLTGSMSLVGPRPPLPDEVAAYATDNRRRLLVTPGLTGLWQVSGRSLLSWEQSVRLDLRYVENWSPAFDLRIMARTVTAVLRRHGAF